MIVERTAVEEVIFARKIVTGTLVERWEMKKR